MSALDETPFDSPRIVCRECESEEEHEFCNGFGWLERIRRWFAPREVRCSQLRHGPELDHCVLEEGHDGHHIY